MCLHALNLLGLVGSLETHQLKDAVKILTYEDLNLKWRKIR